MAAEPANDPIEYWKEVFSQELLPKHQNEFAYIYAYNSGLFRDALGYIKDKNPEHVSKSNYNRLKRCYTRFVLWSRDHSVSSGQLDQRLTRSDDVYHTVHALLVNMCSIVTQRKRVPLTIRDYILCGLIYF